MKNTGLPDFNFLPPLSSRSSNVNPPKWDLLNPPKWDIQPGFELAGMAMYENPPKLQEAENKSRATPRVKETTDKVKNGNNYGCAFPRSLRFAGEKREFASWWFDIIPIIPRLIAIWVCLYIEFARKYRYVEVCNRMRFVFTLRASWIFDRVKYTMYRSLY